MMKFHLSFFDFCLINQPNTHLLTKTKLVTTKPCDKVGFAALYDNESISKSNHYQEPKFNVTYNNLFQSRSSMTGFKKALYNRAKLVRNQLYPSYNRRKYHVSHYNQIKKQCTRLSRTYGYLSQKKINHFIAFASKYDPITRHKRPCVKMIHLLESQLCMIMYRSLFTKSIMMGPLSSHSGQKGSGKKSNSDRFGNISLLKTQNRNHIFPGQLYIIN